MSCTNHKCLYYENLIFLFVFVIVFFFFFQAEDGIRDLIVTGVQTCALPIFRADSRFGGHFVQGHVDAIGHIEELRADAEFHWMTVSFPAHLAPYIVHKGSIAVDGISLTVAGLGADRFDIMVVPYTMMHTNLGGAQIRDKVNLECDMVGKYVVRAAELAGLTLTVAKHETTH